MELYGLDEDILRHEAALGGEKFGPDRLPSAVALAWYLRQRDCARAQALAQECGRWLDMLPTDPETPRHRARLELLQAEIDVLHGRYDEGQARLDRATAAYTALDDPVGLGDAALIAYLLHQVCGVIIPAFDCTAAARRHYAAASDPIRRKAAEAWSLLLMAYGDLDTAERRLDAWGDDAGIPADTAQPRTYATEHPAIACVLLSARAVIYSARNETAQAMLCAARSAQRAEEAGLVRQGIAAADNAGWYLQELGDLDAAAEWMDREYAAASASGWPAVLAFSTTRFGELLRHLGQLERSREMLQQAIALYALVPGGINKGVAYRVLGKTLLALNRPEEALAAYETATQLFRSENYHERLSNALIGAALSLSAAGRPVEALERIEEAGAIATSHRIRTNEIELARARAQIHAQHALPSPTGMEAPTATVHYLEQALAIGRSSEGWQAPVDLLAALSAAWEEGGSDARALIYLKEAMAAERREGHRKAANRTLALQIRHETEQARLEMQHSRQLAAAETERAAMLEATLDELRQVQIELERRRAEFEQLSLIDPLTGIGNRRHFDERAAAEIARARRDGSPLGVAILDIDHFKRVNDRFGHAAGDLVLKQIVAAAQELLRTSDFIARFGGEEFVLLVPGADAAALFRLAERLRRGIATEPMMHGPEPIAVTASFGIALLARDDTTIEDTLARADTALYRAKSEGRDRVVADTVTFTDRDRMDNLSTAHS